MQGDELQKRADQNLVAFLRTELDLGFTFTQTASVEARLRDREGVERARNIAQSALETVRRFKARIVDEQIRRELQERADELEKQLSSTHPRLD